MTHVVRCYQHSLATHRGIDASGMILEGVTEQNEGRSDPRRYDRLHEGLRQELEEIGVLN